MWHLAAQRMGQLVILCKYEYRTGVRLEKRGTTLANYVKQPWTPKEGEQGGNTPFACPGCTAQITMRQMLEFGGWIWGEDGSALDLDLPEWVESELKEGKASWEDRLIPCLQCPRCEGIFAITILDEVIKNEIGTAS